MPQARVDAALVQALILQGLTQAQVGQRLGVSRQAICGIVRRKGVNGMLQRVDARVAQVVAEAKAQQTALARLSAEAKSGLADEVVATTAALRKVPARPRLSSLKDRASVAATVAQTAERVFGWNQQDTASVRVSLLSQPDPAAHVIDVQATPVLPEAAQAEKDALPSQPTPPDTPAPLLDGAGI